MVCEARLVLGIRRLVARLQKNKNKNKNKKKSPRVTGGHLVEGNCQYSGPGILKVKGGPVYLRRVKLEGSLPSDNEKLEAGE